MRHLIVQLVEQSIFELNRELQYEELEKVDESTVLLGDGGLDSLSFVSLIVSIEEEVHGEFNVPVTLADEKAMSRKNSPYRTVGSLVDFVFEAIEAARG